ncbi:MAG: cation diffusion facilitator family transporter [Alphaproteobacteria bacterium]|nr:cation diffusion facilitator family transporter [Alphaproteobacteria bacterium]
MTSAPLEGAGRLPSAQAARITLRTAALSVGVAVFLVGLKAWAWMASGSIALLASLADSTLDLAASFFTFLAVRYAAEPPDAEHRFGHGKAEAFAGLVQAGLVAVSAALVIVEAVRRFIEPAAIRAGQEGVFVMLVSMLATAALLIVQSRAIRKTGSVATAGDRAHYAADLGANVVVIIGLAAGAFFNLLWADALAGVVVALWLGFGAWDVARKAADHLMDRELSDADRDRIRALAMTEPRVRGVHSLRTRASGPYIHIQFHADLDPAISLLEAHDIMVSVEAAICREFPAADVIVHPDPGDRAAPHGHEHFEERHAAGA